MPKNAENLTANQLKFLGWLALPKAERQPRTQGLFADEIGVNETTLGRWKRDYGLDRRAADLAKEQLINHVPDFYEALRKKAKKGSLGHLKMAFEMVEHYTEEVNVNVNHQRQEVIRELSEFEERRRAQLDNGNETGAVAREGSS